MTACVWYYKNRRLAKERSNGSVIGSHSASRWLGSRRILHLSFFAPIVLAKKTAIVFSL